MDEREIETGKLSGNALDWAVALSLKINPHIGSDGTIQNRPLVCITGGGGMGTMPYEEPFRPTFYWGQGGPLLERCAVSVKPITDATWEAEEYITCCKATGLSYLEAACRAIVKAEFGYSVPIPTILLDERP